MFKIYYNTFYYKNDQNTASETFTNFLPILYCLQIHTPKSEKWVDIDYGWSHRNCSLLHTWNGFTDCQKILILLCNVHWIQQCVLDDFFMLQKSYSQTGVRNFFLIQELIISPDNLTEKKLRCAIRIFSRIETLNIILISLFFQPAY